MISTLVTLPDRTLLISLIFFLFFRLLMMFNNSSYLKKVKILTAFAYSYNDDDTTFKLIYSLTTWLVVGTSGCYF